MRIAHLQARILFSIVLGIAAVASCLYAIQGGFGGGSGMYDRVLFVLGLPWILAPWPRLAGGLDYVWLIVLPLILNMTCVAVLCRILRHLQDRAKGQG